MKRDSKKIMTALLVLALSALLCAGAAQARPGDGKGMPARGFAAGDQWQEQGRGAPMMLRMAGALDLTEEQIAKLEQMRDAHRAECLPLRTDIRKLQLDMQKLRLDADPDRAAMEKLIRRTGDLRTELKVMRMNHRQDMRDQLTDQQRDKLDAMRLDRGGRRGPGCRPGRDGRGFGRTDGAPRGAPRWGEEGL